MSNIQIGSLKDNYFYIGSTGQTDPTDTYFFSLPTMGSTRISAVGFSSDINMELRDKEGKTIKSISTSGTNTGIISIDNLGAADYILKISPVSGYTNYQVSLTPDGKVDPLTGMGVDAGFFTTDQKGEVGFDFLNDGGRYQGEIAIFSLDGMETFTSDYKGFIKEAAKRSLSNSVVGHIVISEFIEGANPLFRGSLGEENYNNEPYKGVKTFATTPGKAYAVMLVPNGKVQEVFDNPELGGNKGPLFSLSSLNPNDAWLYGQIADVNGMGLVFSLEDQRVDTGSDRDYQDVIFRLTGATGKAVLLKEVINPAKDWTTSEGGKNFIDFIHSIPLGNTAPKNLQFDVLTAYKVGEQISFTGGKVYDADGVDNLIKVEFSQKKEGGEWVKVSNADTFTADSQGWANFSYSLSELSPGNYEVKAIAYDAAGATSNTVLKSFTVKEATVTPTPTPPPPPTPTPVNTAPKNLQFDVLTAYKVGEQISFTGGKVYDTDGVNDLTKVEFSQRKEGGEWVKVSNADTFTADSQGWANFSYSLSDLSAAKYEVKAIAYDAAGATSNTVLKSFTVKEATVTPTPTPTPTPPPTPTPTPINQSPENLRFSLRTTYKPNEAIQLTNTKIFDSNGADNLAKVDFWLQEEGGEWTDISDATTFTPDSFDNRWATFNYTVNGLAAGKYKLKAIAYDKLGAASNEVMSNFSINTAPNDLQFRILPLYTTGEEISFSSAKVVDAEGVSDIEKIDFWLQKEGGEKIEIANDVTEFESDSKGRGRFNFSYDLSQLTPGRYQLKAIAYDKSGGASEAAAQNFTLITDPGDSGLSDEVRLAIVGSANLEKYDPEALAQTREWLVWLTPGSSSQELAGSLGAADRGAAGYIPNTYRWQFPEDADPLLVQQSLLSLNGVEFAYPLVPRQPKLLSEPEDEPLVRDGTQWHLQAGATPTANVTSAWELARGKGIVIGIIDDGFDYAHPDLAGNYRPDLSWDFNEHDADPSPSYQRTVVRRYLQPQKIADFQQTVFGLKVPLTGVVTDVNVQLDIKHSRVSELEGYLVSPKEPMFDPLIFLSSRRNWRPRPGDPPSELPEVELFQNIDGGGINFSGTIFDDQAIVPIATAIAPFTGRFQPQGSLDRASGQWAPGSWQLRINDDAPSNATGQLNRFGLEFRTYNPHGTPVAGVAAASGSNGYQTSGVAPEASFAGLRLIADEFTDIDLANALYDLSGKNRNQSIDIYNNSWKDESWLSDSGLGVQAMELGVKQGRGGLGNIYIYGAGNDALDGGNANYNGLANSRYAIAVGAIDHTGRKSSYSEPGASLLVSAYSSGGDRGITAADMTGTQGYDEKDYTNGFGGTSAAAPFLSGVTALMLSKNPSLSWRDVQHILVETAQKNDPYDPDWRVNGAGRGVNHKYGFGAVDPVAAVKKAITWTPVDLEAKVKSSWQNVIENIPDDRGETGLSSTVKINEDITVENVEIEFDVDHKDWRDLTVKLKSPDGTESFLVQPIPEGQAPNNNYQVVPDSAGTPWMFASTRHWGESSKGEWTLEVIDENGNEIQGFWHSWKLNLYGTKPTVSIQATDAIASENGDTGTMTVTRRGNTKYDLKVNYSMGGTASEDLDYQRLSGSVTIPAGQSSVVVPITPVDDASVEEEETVAVTLSAGQDYTVGKDRTAIVAIADNDERPNVVTNTKDSGSGSLRAVLNWANSNPGKDTVIFKIPTTDSAYNTSTNSFTIRPLSPLPQITDPAVIDGTSQPGYSERPVIELDGSNVSVDGLYISAGNSTVRGLTINRFGVDGIRLIDNGGNIIEGNFIGTDVTGTQDLGNGFSGISIVTPNNTIGGKAIGTSNVISGNGKSGIFVNSPSATSNAILSNSISGNGELGIDLNDGGITMNDVGDSDTGANNVQNFPELTSAISSNGNTIIKGKINSIPNTTFRVELFSNKVLDDSGFGNGGFGNGGFGGGGYGEGEKFLGFQNVTTDSSGNATVAVNLPLAVPIGQFITATATDPNNNTSEFSQGISLGSDTSIQAEWIRQLGTSSFDASQHLGLSSEGNIYITGTTTGSLAGTKTGDREVWLAKYSNNGTQQWSRQWNINWFNYSDGITVDNSSNVYVLSSATGQPQVDKYTSDGTLLWSNKDIYLLRDNSGNAVDQVTHADGITTDNLGNFYITGSGFNHNIGAFVAKYDANGNHLWTRSLKSSGWQLSRSVAVDLFGNVYLAGHTDGSLEGNNAGEIDAWVAKYDSSGNLQWIDQFGTPSNDIAWEIKVDNSGNVYLGGDTQGSLAGTNAGGTDAWLAKYSSDGTSLWIKQWGTSGNERVSGITIDSSGSPYVSNENSLTKYDSSGNSQWTRQLGTAGNSSIESLVIDRAGKIYATGKTQESLEGQNAGSFDAWVAKLIPPQ